MAKQSKDAKRQKVAKAAIRATRKTTIKKPAKPSRKEHVKQSTISAVWVTVGILVCILVVVFGIFKSGKSSNKSQTLIPNVCEIL